MTNRLTESPARTFSGCLLSAVLLTAAFPKWDLWLLAWIGLAPLMLVLDGKSPRAAFGWSYLFGFLFFYLSLNWIGIVDRLAALYGLPALAAFLALYAGFFGLAYRVLERDQSPVSLLTVPAAWVVLEWARAHILSGFSFASLSHTQYLNLGIIQFSDITGAYGVSFLIVLVNLAVKRTIDYWRGSHTSEESKRWHVAVLISGIALCLALVYGVKQMMLSPWRDGPSLRVAVVQGNIAQDDKWVESSWPDIIDKHIQLSKRVLPRQPDLLVWPETSFPGFLNEQPLYFSKMQRFVMAQNIPLLFGTVADEGDDVYYNSAVLLTASGAIDGQYNKMKLVPFGEFLPLRNVLPALSDVVPIADFSVGDKATVFYLEDEDSGEPLALFSAFICFEDIFPHVIRRFVVNGAQFLVNLSNDAWFGDSNEPYMHLQSSVFRAVENRRTLIRATNTGVSGFVSPTGAVSNTVHDASGKEVMVEGTAVEDIALHSRLSFYSRFGDVFVYLCLALVAGILGFYAARKRILIYPTRSN